MNMENYIYMCCEQKTVWMKLNETNIQIELQRTTAPSRVLQSVTMIRMWLGQFFRWLSVLVLKKIWILGKWSGYDKRSLRISSCWWFQPSWKILVNGKDYLIYYGKKMFQTTNQQYMNYIITGYYMYPFVWSCPFTRSPNLPQGRVWQRRVGLSLDPVERRMRQASTQITALSPYL